MDIKKQFGTNSSKEIEGAWIDLGEGASLKVARLGNKENRALIQKLTTPHRVALRNGKLGEDLVEKITIEAMAATILLDWKGIELDGKALPYSRDNAIKLLTEYKDFREQVSAFAADIALFQDEEEAAAVKN